MARLGITQSDVADAVGINRGVMNRYMRNQREWPIRVLDKIAPALKWQDGLDIFIAANSEEKEPQSALAKSWIERKVFSYGNDSDLVFHSLRGSQPRRCAGKRDSQQCQQQGGELK
nr:helix-turn-helix transcriptional regulator [Bifidobacterium adolescentis]